MSESSITKRFVIFILVLLQGVESGKDSIARNGAKKILDSKAMDKVQENDGPPDFDINAIDLEISKETDMLPYQLNGGKGLGIASPILALSTQDTKRVSPDYSFEVDNFEMSKPGFMHRKKNQKPKRKPQPGNIVKPTMDSSFEESGKHAFMHPGKGEPYLADNEDFEVNYSPKQQSSQVLRAIAVCLDRRDPSNVAHFEQLKLKNDWMYWLDYAAWGPVIKLLPLEPSNKSDKSATGLSKNQASSGKSKVLTTEKDRKSGNKTFSNAARDLENSKRILREYLSDKYNEAKDEKVLQSQKISSQPTLPYKVQNVVGMINNLTKDPLTSTNKDTAVLERKRFYSTDSDEPAGMFNFSPNSHVTTNVFEISDFEDTVYEEVIKGDKVYNNIGGPYIHIDKTPQTTFLSNNKDSYYIYQKPARKESIAKDDSFTDYDDYAIPARRGSDDDGDWRDMSSIYDKVKVISASKVRDFNPRFGTNMHKDMIEHKEIDSPQNSSFVLAKKHWII